MSNEKQEIMVKYEIDGQEIKLTPSIVQEYIVGTDAKITMQEFKLFTELCKCRKLNPFLREAYLIKYKSGQPASLVVGKDAILKRAVLNSNYNGMKSGIIVQKEDGIIEERKGLFYIPGKEIIVGGWAEVYRKDWEHPTYCSVSFDEVAQRKSDGNLNSNWATKKATMIEKVAKVRALRETFVEDLAGMYEAEEMDTPPTKDVTEVVEVVEQVEPQEEIEEVVSMSEL